MLFGAIVFDLRGYQESYSFGSYSEIRFKETPMAWGFWGQDRGSFLMEARRGV